MIVRINRMNLKQALATNLKQVNRQWNGQRYCNSRHDTALYWLQHVLNNMLDCKTAYAGSTALYVHGEVPTYGDIDVVTDRIFTHEEVTEIFGCEPDSKGNYGYQFWASNLDIFFTDRPKNKQLMALANAHITTVNGLRVQTSRFVKEVNWYWRHGKKERLVAYPTIEGLGEAL